MPDQKYIPSLERLAEAAQQLPNASMWRQDFYEVKMPNGRTIPFRRLKMKDRLGRGYRWVFDGKVSAGEGGHEQEADKGFSIL